MSAEAVRKEFEAWKEEYSKHSPIRAWAAWQASRSAAIQECADTIREQKKKYPDDIFEHIENFREVECWDCCGAATALHTMGWLADFLLALKER